MIITVSGAPGAGKSTVSRLLAKRLKYRHYSIGDVMRTLAHERGMTLERFERLLEKRPSIDKEIDAYQARLGRTQDRFVIDGRVSWRFIPRSFKVFLAVKERVAAARIWKDRKAGRRKGEQPARSLADVARQIRQRAKSERAQYRRYYGVDYFNRRHYDLVVDTGKKTPAAIVQLILKAAKKNKP